MTVHGGPGPLGAFQATEADARAPSDSFQRLARLATRLLDAPVAMVSIVDGDVSVYDAAKGGGGVERHTAISGTCCDAITTTAVPLVVGDIRAHPDLVGQSEGCDRSTACLGVPLLAPDGRVLGAFCVEDQRPREWSDDDIAALADLAASATSELALTEAVDAERAARKQAEVARQINEFLASASEVLARSLDLGETLESLARLTVPQFADWCAVDLLEEGGRLERVALVARGDADANATRALRENLPQILDADVNVGHVLRTGQVELVEVVDEDYLDRWAGTPQRRELLTRLGKGSLVVLPLIARGRTLGTVTLVSTEPGHFDPSWTPFLDQLALRAAVAVDNARAYAARDEIARTLQRNLLPPRLPTIEGLEVASRFHPSGDGLDVGGDFYDVFETGPGPWLAVIGDVCGKGPEAAAVTGLARHTIRAAAMQHRSPARILRTLNDVLCAESELAADENPDALLASDHRFLTVAAVRASIAADGHVTLLIAVGGHHLPLLLRADGALEAVGTAGDAIGLLHDLDVDDTEVHLGPGDALVLTTDGVTDARDGEGRFLGDDGLAELVTSCAGASADKIADTVASAAIDLQRGRAHDDIAVLVLRIPPR